MLSRELITYKSEHAEHRELDQPAEPPLFRLRPFFVLFDNKHRIFKIEACFNQH